MPRLTIIMKGVSLTYDRNGTWTTIFPFRNTGDCHQVRLINGPFNPGGTPLAAPGGRFLVAATGSAVTAAPGTGFENFVDLTNSEYSHQRLRMKDGWEEHAVVLTIEGATLMQHEPTKCHYRLRETGGITQRPFTIIAYSAEAVVDAGFITLDYGVGSTEITQDTMLTINNECDQNLEDPSGDLALLYEYIIEDADTPHRTFVIERDPSEEPPPDFDYLFERHSVTVKNLARENNNPAKYERGIPCNKFIASNPEGLF